MRSAKKKPHRPSSDPAVIAANVARALAEAEARATDPGIRDYFRDLRTGSGMTCERQPDGSWRVLHSKEQE